MSRMRGAIVAAVLLGAGLAGCVENVELEPADGVQHAKEVDGRLVAAGAGILAGQVLGDTGVPVLDARVFTVPDGRSRITDAEGRFEFVNVTAGTQLLRVEATGFRAHESEVEVVAGEMVEVEVTMLPTDTRGAGYRSHIHDYWDEATELNIFDAEFDLRQSRVGSATADWNEQANYASATVLYANTVYGGLRYWVPMPNNPEEPKLVYPGTGQIKVTFDWDDTPPMPPQYALFYERADSSEEFVTAPGGPGTTWTIDVEESMTDHGHQSYTLWEFYVLPVNNVQDPTTTGYRPSLLTENVEVKIDVIKGRDPGAEPAHPRFWENGNELAILNHTDRTSSCGGTGVWGCAPMLFPNTGSIVPPGTSKLIVDFKWTYTGTTPTQAQGDYVLYWNTGEYNYNERKIAQWATGSPKEGGSGGTAVYEIEVAPHETDAFYQTKSSWRFAPRLEGTDPDNRVDQDYFSARSFTASIVAVRGDDAEAL